MDDSLPPAANLENLRLLILLRWIAVAGQVITIMAVDRLMGIPLPLPAMLGTLGLLAAWNVASILRWRTRRPVTGQQLFANLLIDVLALSVQLYLSGGAANPFVSLFLLHVILGAVLLEMRWAIVLTAITVAAFLVLAVVSRPLALAHHHGGDFFGLHLVGMFLCFVLTAGLLLFFLARIATNQRRGEARLAELRQRAAEENHVVRMGLLAAGAAHELGTPLSTLSVILNDWARLSFFARDGEARAELKTMTTQLERCKIIVSGILQSSGELRGEGTVRTTIRRFLDEAVGEWTSLRQATGLAYENLVEPDQPIVSDAALNQVVANLLDNAVESGADTIGLVARRLEDQLHIVVWDDGPGMEASVLERFGQPYVTTKTKPGGGLGLFLVVNTVRKLGGTVQAANRSAGGASVTLSIPLSALGAAS